MREAAESQAAANAQYDGTLSGKYDVAGSRREWLDSISDQRKRQHKQHIRRRLQMKEQSKDRAREQFMEGRGLKDDTTPETGGG